MAGFNLSQNDAEILMKIDKYFVDRSVQAYPNPGGNLALLLRSEDDREKFRVDVNRRNLDEHKVTHINLARQTVSLFRLDLGGSPHRNPDRVC